MRARITFFMVLSMAAALAAQSITVTSPKAGDPWCKGKSYDITWDKKGNLAATVNIRLWQGPTAIQEIVNKTANTGSYSWAIPATLADGTYTIRIKTSDNKVMGISKPFTIKGCSIGNLPPPPPPPTEEPPIKMKSQVEIMQQPPQITQPTISQPPNTIVISQLPKAKINKFAPNKTAIAPNEQVTITIDAENVTKATVHDDAAGKSLDFTPQIEKNALKINFSLTPSRPGTWRLAVSNLTSKADDSFILQPSVVLPVIVSFTPSRTTFYHTESIPMQYTVKWAESVFIVDEYNGHTLALDSLTFSPADTTGSLSVKPLHTCKIHLVAKNIDGTKTSQTIQLVNMKEQPVIGQFEAGRNTVIGIPTDAVTVKYKVRGYRYFTIYWRDANSSDIPQNYHEVKKYECPAYSSAELFEGQYEFKPKVFPCVVKVFADFWDDSKTTYLSLPLK